MLKYVIVLLIILFCDAKENRSAGKYEKLILAQNSPLTSFFNEYRKWPDKSTSFPYSGLSKHDCALLFRGKKWIAHGLWPHKTKGSPSYCRKGPNAKNIMKYIPEKMDRIFTDTLKTTWPDLSANRTKKSIWNTEWNKHGTCVTDVESLKTIKKYFFKTVELLNKYNIGSILEIYSIVPGNDYTINRITTALTTYFKKSTIIKCLQNENLEKPEQYLLEIEICFDKTLSLTDCHGNGTFNCNTSETVYYPIWKEN